MLKRSKFGVHRGLPNSEASGDARVSLDNVCASSPTSPVPWEGSWDPPCIAIPAHSEDKTVSQDSRGELIENIADWVLSVTRPKRELLQMVRAISPVWQNGKVNNEPVRLLVLQSGELESILGGGRYAAESQSAYRQSSRSFTCPLGDTTPPVKAACASRSRKC